MIIGIGIDVVENTRFRSILSNNKLDNVEKHFTTEEVVYCTKKKDSYKYFSGTFAVKEAVFKALQLQWKKGFSWRDIAVKRFNGIPEVKLSGYTETRAKSLGVKKIFVSISHCNEYAIAMVIITGGILDEQRSSVNSN